MPVWRVLLTVAVSLSAVLLFGIQPMFSKLLLPMLGGVPVVWNTCLVFYQAMLLLGYVYVHITSSRLSARQQTALHIGVLWLAWWMLSFRLEPDISMYERPVSWLVGQLLRSIGLPFFALSATAPLLQRWLARAPHPDARNPYVLYAASNVGAIVALLGYTLLVEPLFQLQRQSWSWTWGYLALAAVVTVCGGLLWRIPQSTDETFHLAPSQERNPVVSPQVHSSPPTWTMRLQWMLYAFVPSGLLLGVTNHITTDIAPIPLLWIIPLILYLLTFVLVFAPRPWLRHAVMLRAQTYLALPPLLLYIGKLNIEVWIDFPVHLTTFFVFTMVCHGELARRRPHPEYLTEFYMWLATGGVLGGIFTALVAPLLFNSIVEYALLLVLACVIRPNHPENSRPNISVLLITGLLAFLLLPIGLMSGRHVLTLYLGAISLILVSGVGGAVAFVWLRTPLRVVLALGGVLFSGSLLITSQQDVLERTRSFFGTVKVVNDATDGYHLFYHGTTLQGAQAIDAQERQVPRTYHHQQGPLGQVFAMLDDQPTRSVAVLGLGVGTIAAYGRPQDSMTFYEIDAEVETVARNSAWFTYLSDSAATIDVVLGDARMSLAYAPQEAFDLILQDAFSSDSIPSHLLTREAFQLYLQKLTPTGLLACNITNRYLNLEPVLATLLADTGLVGLIREDDNLSPEDQQDRRFPSIWVVAARRDVALDALRQDARWRPLRAKAGMRVWTDDYSNILGVLKSPF